MDTTFSIGPHGTDLHVVLALVGDQAIPIAFAITDGRKALHYTFLLQQLRQRGLDPAFVHVDFDHAEHKAIVEVFPNATIIGCAFHFMQACYRNYVKHHGKSAQDKWQQVKNFLHRLLVASTANEFRETFQALRAFAYENGIRQFFNYFATQWITKVSPTIWAIFGITDSTARRTRTNNFLESFNAVLKSVHFDNRRFLGLPRVAETLSDVLDAQLVHLRAAQRSATFRSTAADAVLDELVNATSKPAAPAQRMLIDSPGTAASSERFPQHVRDFLQANDMQIINTVTNGLCQHDALASGMFRSGEAEYIRTEVIRELVENQRLRAFLEPFITQQDGGSLDAFIQRLRETNEWGNHITLIAFATRFRRNVTVIRTTHAAPTTIVPFEREAIEPTVFVLFAEEQQHYYGLVPRNRRDALQAIVNAAKYRGRRNSKKDNSTTFRQGGKSKGGRSTATTKATQAPNTAGALEPQQTQQRRPTRTAAAASSNQPQRNPLQCARGCKNPIDQDSVGQRNSAAQCDQCDRTWHIACADPSLRRDQKTGAASWACRDCREDIRRKRNHRDPDEDEEQID